MLNEYITHVNTKLHVNILLKLRVNINKTIVGYLPIENLYVGSYGKPNCGWKPYGH
jgi:hypothetical protein